MSAVRVHAPVAAYAVAVRELPVSAVLALEGPADVVVVAGPEWMLHLEHARRSASVVVAAGDLPGAATDIERLRGAGRVVLERRRLRRDLVDDALAGRSEHGARAPRLLVAECITPAHDLEAAVRDALGWSRELAGPLVLAQSSADADAVSALLLGGPHSVPVVIRAAVALVPRTVLRVTAFGEVSTEVLIDDLGGRCSVSTLDASGRAEAPSRFESLERFTLRRALEAVEADEEQRRDLGDLASDAALAEAILRGKH